LKKEKWKKEARPSKKSQAAEQKLPAMALAVPPQEIEDEKIWVICSAGRKWQSRQNPPARVI